MTSIVRLRATVSISDSSSGRCAGVSTGSRARRVFLRVTVHDPFGVDVREDFP